MASILLCPPLFVSDCSAILFSLISFPPRLLPRVLFCCFSPQRIRFSFLLPNHLFFFRIPPFFLRFSCGSSRLRSPVCPYLCAHPGPSPLRRCTNFRPSRSDILPSLRTTAETTAAFRYVPIGGRASRHSSGCPPETVSQRPVRAPDCCAFLPAILFGDRMPRYNASLFITMFHVVPIPFHIITMLFYA